MQKRLQIFTSRKSKEIGVINAKVRRRATWCRSEGDAFNRRFTDPLGEARPRQEIGGAFQS